MTTQEMHIAIDLELQKINSQVNKNLLPQEKDWFLNNEVEKFIKQRKSPDSNIKKTGFQDNSKRIEDLKDLITIKTLPVHQNNTGGKYIILPPDYFDYVRFDARLKKSCTIGNDTTTTKTYYKTSFSIPTISGVNLTAFSITLNRDSGADLVFDIATLPTGYIINSDFRKQEFLLYKALKIQLESKFKALLTIDSSPLLYWEFEGESYTQGTYTLVTTEPTISISVLSNANSVLFNTVTETREEYKELSLPLTGSIRVQDEEFLLNAVNSTLSSSKPHSILATIRKHTLELFEPNSVIVGYVRIAYICKPQLIDLYLNSNLNMSSKVCKEITSNTIRFLKAVTQDPTYNAYVAENVLIE